MVSFVVAMNRVDVVDLVVDLVDVDLDVDLVDVDLQVDLVDVDLQVDPVDVVDVVDVVDLVDVKQSPVSSRGDQNYQISNTFCDFEI